MSQPVASITRSEMKRIHRLSGGLFFEYEKERRAPTVAGPYAAGNGWVFVVRNDTLYSSIVTYSLFFMNEAGKIEHIARTEENTTIEQAREQAKAEAKTRKERAEAVGWMSDDEDSDETETAEADIAHDLIARTYGTRVVEIWMATFGTDEWNVQADIDHESYTVFGTSNDGTPATITHRTATTN